MLTLSENKSHSVQHVGDKKKYSTSIMLNAKTELPRDYQTQTEELHSVNKLGIKLIAKSKVQKQNRFEFKTWQQETSSSSDFTELKSAEGSSPVSTMIIPLLTSDTSCE